ncbi:hypothetical protein A225_2943 [Klebsiella michiganensis E718]|nr:hypothetical protein A225_2943 [Klebsiella michiganensis E718]
MGGLSLAARVDFPSIESLPFAPFFVNHQIHSVSLFTLQ